MSNGQNRCPVIENCIDRKRRQLQESQRYNDNVPEPSPLSDPESPEESSLSSVVSCHFDEVTKYVKDEGAQATSGPLELADSFWDSLINFMQESSKVMENYKENRPVQMTAAEKQEKMKELLKKIEEKEKEIKELNEEFQQLLPSKKRCPAKIRTPCPRTQGADCPEPNCDEYEEEFESYTATYAPIPYNINQTYQQYSPPPSASAPQMQRYDPNVQSQMPYPRSPQQPNFDSVIVECDGVCRSPCSSNCQKPCALSWKPYSNY